MAPDILQVKIQIKRLQATFGGLPFTFFSAFIQKKRRNNCQPSCKQAALFQRGRGNEHFFCSLSKMAKANIP